MLKWLFKRILDKDQARARKELRYCLEAKKRGFIKAPGDVSILWKD